MVHWRGLVKTAMNLVVTARLLAAFQEELGF
jgi:hypothetical protein